MKKLAVLILLLAVLTTQQVSAHVLVSDETNTKGAILHIVPDDDPIAGEPATLYFDTQNDLLSALGSSVQLTVTDADGQQTIVPTKVDGPLATATYTFPEQGAYSLRFDTKSGDQTATFVQAQRITRGATGSQLDKPSYAWAEAVLVSVITIGAVGSIIIFNRRLSIAKQGDF